MTNSIKTMIYIAAAFLLLVMSDRQAFSNYNRNNDELVSASRTKPVPAFPGAQGFGSTTPGGRGGRVIAVTNLEPEGPGSFREACEADGPRIVIFRVGGTITLENKIVIQNPFITIAGQTAPGDGICIKGAALQIATHDVIVRGLRIRIGDGPGPEPSNRDALAIANRTTKPYNIIIDHCSLSWAIDENLQLWYPCNNITIQWCIISEGLHNSLHPKRPHSCGLIIGNYAKNISAHHNLFAHNDGRSPLMKQGSESEFINNVVYNWGDFGASRVSNWEKHDATIKANIISNYYIPGTNSSIKPIDLQAPERLRKGTKIFVKDNIGPGRMSDDIDDWALVSGDEKFRANQLAIPLSNVSIVSASSAYEQVIKYAGAVTPKRDTVDQRVIYSVINKTGQIIDSQRDVGGWPHYAGGEPPPDRDGDGMPDEWERAQGLNPNDAADGALDLDGDVYTNVEEFLNQTDPKKPDDGLEPVH
jgi:pectate lyase